MKALTQYVIKDAVKGVNINSNDSKLAFDEMKTSGIKIIYSKKCCENKKAITLRWLSSCPKLRFYLTT